MAISPRRCVSASGALDRPVADVFAVVHSVEVDVLDGVVGALLRVGDGFAEGGDGEDAAAVGDDLAVGFTRTGVEDFDVGHGVGLFDAGDGQAAGVLAGVAFAGGDDAKGGAGV